MSGDVLSLLMTWSQTNSTCKMLRKDISSKQQHPDSWRMGAGFRTGRACEETPHFGFCADFTATYAHNDFHEEMFQAFFSNLLQRLSHSVCHNFRGAGPRVWPKHPLLVCKLHIEGEQITSGLTIWLWSPGSLENIVKPLMLQGINYIYLFILNILVYRHENPFAALQ